MWIFLNNAFVSAVEHRDNPKKVLLRARVKGDIEAFVHPLFPTELTIAVNTGSKVFETPDADYRFRLALDKRDFGFLVKWHAEHIDYDNFKGSIAPEEKERHDVYLRVWSVMYDWQSKLYGWGRKWLTEHPIAG